MCRILSALTFALTVSAVAQPVDGQGRPTLDQQRPAFDVVSIKPNTSDSPASSIAFEPGGRFHAINEPVVRMIQEAFGTPRTPRPEVLGAPSWIESDRFDVETVVAPNASREQQQSMLRAMLADRFHLMGHTETRERAVYNLVRPARDAKGDKLHASDGACAALGKPGAGTPTPEQIRPCMLAFFPGSLSVNGMTASEFATRGLSRVVDRPVIDRTGLGDTEYDWAVEWAPQPASPGDRPSSVFSAVQEQLGLRLEPSSAAVDVVVIERIDRPSPN
jgi:uncharacterized protein (TIGR03435 family)